MEAEEKNLSPVFNIDKDQLKDPFEKQWYLSINDTDNGPYSYTELCLVIANDDIKPSEKVTLLGHGSWHRLDSCDLFKKLAAIQFLKDNKVSLDTDVPLRRSIRVPLFLEVAIVCETRMFKGVTCNMSTSGMMIKLNKQAIREGDNVKIHIYSDPNQNVEPISFKAKVVRMIKTESHELFSRFESFGVEFEDIDTEKKEIVKSLVRLGLKGKVKSSSIGEIFGRKLKDLNYGPRNSKIAV